MDRKESSTRSDGWIETEATIVSCKRILLSSIRGQGITGEGFFEPPEYTVEFSYAVAREVFSGKYVAHSEQAMGSTLTIAYDPTKPSQNTGSNLIRKPWVRIVAWAAGVGLAALAIWLDFSDVPPF